MRDKFEAWWENWAGDKPFSGWNNLRTPEGYNDQEIDLQWEAFCAGFNLNQQQDSE